MKAKTNFGKITILNVFLLIMALGQGCAEKPEKKIAHGEDYNLIAKEAILGEAVAPSTELALFSGNHADLSSFNSKILNLVSNTADKEKTMWFDISESYLTLNQEIDGQNVATYRYKIGGHYDLAPGTGPDGVENQYLSKTTKKNARWQDREFIVVDPTSAKKIEADEQTLNDVFAKSEVIDQIFVWGLNEIPVLSENKSLVKELTSSALVSLVDGDLISTSISEDYLYFYKNDELFVKFSITGHFDLVADENGNGEKTAKLVKNTRINLWENRAHFSVDPYEPLIVRVSTDIKELANKLLTKEDFDHNCMAAEDVKPSSILAALTDLGVMIAPLDEVCFEVSQSVLSVYVGGYSDNQLAMTLDISSHVDVEKGVSDDGKDVSHLIVKNTKNPNWKKRKFVIVSIDNPHIVKYTVQPNAISKSDLEGEFIYTATVTEAHSENGLFFVGQSLQSMDRLEFKFSSGNITAYKVNEKLNDSGAKSPFLRYSTSQFDVQRLKNGFGNRTNTIGENTENPWNERKYARINFQSNQIPGYFNSLLGIQKYYSGLVLMASSQLAEEIEIEDDLISFVTEEVITPNAKAGFSGAGETQYQPVAIKIKHTFLKVGKRTYTARNYDDHDFAKFGYFRATELGIDPVLGKTDDTVKQYARMFDIQGNKTIDFVLSKNFPEKYKDEAQEVADAWNKAFKDATGRDGVVQIKANNGEDFADPRTSMIAFIDSRSVAAPLGYGPTVFDPTTGENISGKSYIYGDAIKSVLRSAGLYYDLVRGLRSREDFMTASGASRTSSSGESSIVANPMLFGSRTPITKSELEEITRDSAGFTGESLTSMFDRLSDQGNRTAQGIIASKVGSEMISAANTIDFNKKPTHMAEFEARHQGCQWDVDKTLVSAGNFINSFPELSKEAVLAQLESKMVFTTLLHEVGHNLGLRHNFKGTFDQTNFPIKYWELVTSGPDAPTETGEWEGKYTTSSVMDYTDTFEGLYKDVGPYDTAAIKYAYGKKLEVETGIDELGMSIFKDIDLDEYTNVLDELAIVNPEATRNQLIASLDRDLKVKQYQFCSDEHVLEDPTCNRFDRGTTVKEIAESMISDYDTIYYLNGFRRGRRMFTGGSSYIMGRFILPLRQLLDEYIYRIVTGGFAPDSTTPGLTMPESQDDYLDGVKATLGFYAKILNTMEPGMYHLDEEKGEFIAGQSSEEGAKNLRISNLEGKYLKSRSINVGLNRQITSRGIETDKASVLYAMALRGYPASKYAEAGLNLNFFDIVEDYTFDKFSNYMRGDYKIDLTIALPEGSTVYQPAASVATPVGEPLTAKIAPSTSTYLEQFSMIFAMTSYDTPSNRGFGDYIDFRVVGVNDTLPEGVETIKFKSASGLKEYVVPQTQDGRSISFAVAKDAASQAKKLAEARKLLSELEEPVELGQVIIEEFSKAWLIGNESEITADILETLNGDLDRFLDIMINMTNDWITAAEGNEEALLALGEAKEALEAAIAEYKNYSETKSALETEVSDNVSALQQVEADLIQMQTLYKLFR